MNHDLHRTGEPDPVDEAVARFRRTVGDAPPAVTDAAVSSFRARQQSRHAAGWETARMLLVLAGLAGVLLNGLALADGLGHAGQDLVAMKIAVSIGFLLAAYRPDKYARGMAPVAAAAAALLFLPTFGDTTLIAEQAIAEAAHLPIVAGAAGLLLGRWDRQGVGA